MQQLILGGVRSGKSQLAEQAALASGLAVTYIATSLISISQSGDGSLADKEMQQRITKHRQRRPDDWALLEAPYALAGCLQQQAAVDRCLLVDCLTAWLTNLLCADDETLLAKEMDALLEVLPELPGEIIFVSNETSMGIVPMGELTRRFCDEAGLLHQAIARQCDRVVLSIAGLAQVLKDESVKVAD
ncbi:bifunctional adenosylcobinamide kinase/adenosylcobinamide-phosphate guanylyltransferase [Beggiatoa alba]|nr:bifunctional adenosylcobinamide kinase/adenosylcobinamide-phosphate guanylyltransferase [Beggiatoa alba]